MSGVRRKSRRGMVSARLRVSVNGNAQPEHECLLGSPLSGGCQVIRQPCAYWMRRDGWLPEGCPLLGGPVTIRGVMQEEQT